MLGGAVATAWHAAGDVPKAVQIIGSVCGIIGGAIGVGIFPVKPRGGAVSVLALGLFATLAVTACNPRAALWRTAAGVRGAGTLTDGAIADAARAMHARCKPEGPPKSPGRTQCIKGSREWRALTIWRGDVRPAINAALIATVTALTIAERVKGSKLDAAEVIKLLKAGGCGIVKILAQFPKLLAAKAPAIAVGVAAFKGVCK